MDESPEEEWKRDEAFFLRELEDIAVCKEKMDIVLFPVDPRFGKGIHARAFTICETDKNDYICTDALRRSF